MHLPARISLTQRGIMPNETVVAGSGSVPVDYAHYPKLATPQADLVLPGGHLKWYDLARESTPVPAELGAEARAFLQAEQAAGTLKLNDELGFVVHHRCGESFFFLIVNTWRNANELWETVYYKDGLDFPGLRLVAREENHKPTYCVWELGPVQHEQGAWQRYLRSACDDKAREEYLGDRFEGLV